MLLKGFWALWIIFMNVCVVITVAVVMLLKGFWALWIIFMNVFTTLDFPAILDGQFTSII
jgi:hypothetical protein